MRENMSNPISNEDRELVGGEVVSVEGSRIRVRLDSGKTGFATPPERAGGDELRVGGHATFRVTGTESGGFASLAFAENQNDPAGEEPFDREVVQLHNALANHHPSNSVRPVERVHLGEEQIQSWIGRVEESLDRLRKHRAKRLNEEFYDGS